MLPRPPHGEDSEAQPLLIDRAINTRARPGRKPKWERTLVVIIGGVVTSASQFGTYLAIPAQTAIFEQIVCRKYLQLQDPWNNPDPAGNVDFCKSEEVQSELALILGYKNGLDMIPSILLSLPYGILADHWGRRPVVLLSVLGVLLGEIWLRFVAMWSNVLPLRLVFLVADVCTEENLSTTLFRLSACSRIAEMLATTASAYLMTLTPWLSYMLALAIMLVGCLPSLLLPETLKSDQAEDPMSSELLSEEPVGPREPPKSSILLSLWHKVRGIKEATQLIWDDRNIALIILAVSASSFSTNSELMNILLQFASKKFKWSISRVRAMSDFKLPFILIGSQASLLISIRGIFCTVNFLLLMPTWNYLAARFLDLHGKYRDYVTSQGSGVLLVVGFTLMALAPKPEVLILGIIVMSLGTALIMASRSLATEFIASNHVGTLFAVIAILCSIANLIASPLMAYLFKLGMHMGEAWMGLPLLLGTLLTSIATIAVWQARLDGSSPPKPVQEDEDTDTRAPLVPSELPNE
ncbi:hypothetical protein N7470_003755 [Penicillium chermesinum]|nr:hypothetical protein N7470_003755 [Penicillium chermesinum]